MYKKTVLDNGLRIISASMPGRKSLALGFWVCVGSRYEEPRQAGISHYLEHMVFKGTKKYSCLQIKESIEGVGGSFNGFTSEELTCYFIKMPARYIDRGVDILSDMIAAPMLRSPDVKKERTVILEEIKMYKDQPQSYVYEMLDGLLWPGHPLGTSTLGTDETVSSIDSRALFEYRSRSYSAANIVVSAAGAFDHAKLTEAVSKRFSRISRGLANRCTSAEDRQDSPNIAILGKETEQSHLAIGFRGLRRDHPLRYSLLLLHIILGANSSSRLFNEIREKRGLAYEIGTHVKLLKDTGSFIVHAGVDNKRVKDTVELVFEQLQKIKDRPVSKGELKRAKEFYLGQLTLAMEDTMDQMLWIGETTAALDRTFTIDDIMRLVKKVSADDIKEVAAMLLKKDRINFAMIGPWKGKERSVRTWLGLR